jgi:hypothetical protein
MWKELNDNIETYFGYDGSNWQAVVGMLLASPISTIFYGWQLLCSGANTTSLEGILCMIICLSLVWPDVKKACLFGDDVMIDRDKGLGIPNLLARDETEHSKVFLGYNVAEKRAMGLKVCVDNSDKMLSTNKEYDGVAWKINEPTIQQKIALIIVYGFSEVTNPIQLNINSEEFYKPSRIMEGLEYDMWRACVAEFHEKFESWWSTNKGDLNG